MLPYLILFAFFAIAALFSRMPVIAAADGSDGHASGETRVTTPGIMFALGGVLMALMIGLRDEVGGDWLNYVRMLQRARLDDFAEVFDRSDPAYHLLNWLSSQLGLGLWAVNLVCAAIFTWGLVRFARVQPLPWLVMVVAIPYLVTVVAMGYTRQAVAIGLLLAGFASLFSGGSFLRFACYAVLAALFHRTAVLALPLVIFSTDRGRLLTGVAGILLIYGLYASLLAEDVDKLVRNYIDARYNSQGALIRVILIVIPAGLFFLLRKRLKFGLAENKFWRLNSLAALALMVALFVVPSSTAVDRIALYIFPLQLAVMSRLPIAFPSQLTTFAVVLYSLAIQLGWLLFAVHAQSWLPYRTTLF